MKNLIFHSKSDKIILSWFEIFSVKEFKTSRIAMKEKSSSKKDSFENEVFNTWLDDDGVCHAVVKKGAKIELDHAKENSAFVRELGIRVPILVDARNVITMSKAARDHFAMRDRKGGVNSIAILIESPLSRLIGNFFMGLNKPSVPTKLFTSEKKALEWLHKFL